MYYVDRQQIEQRLQFLSYLINACERIQQNWSPDNVLNVLAQERILHLAVETVTDVGSLVIDGFIMRDASSYEDIIEILAGENVFPLRLKEPLLSLVKLRKPLVQEYITLDRQKLNPLIPQLPTVLSQWGQAVRKFLTDEGIK